MVEARILDENGDMAESVGRGGTEPKIRLETGSRNLNGLSVDEWK